MATALCLVAFWRHPCVELYTKVWSQHGIGMVSLCRWDRTNLAIGLTSRLTNEFPVATFCALAGVDATDHRAALANLPPIDSFDHSGLILGTTMESPRKELPIGTEPRASNLSNAPLCSSYIQAPYYGDSRLGGADVAPPPPKTGRCTTVSGLIVDEGAAGLWKLLTGEALLAGPLEIARG